MQNGDDRETVAQHTKQFHPIHLGSLQTAFRTVYPCLIQKGIQKEIQMSYCSCKEANIMKPTLRFDDIDFILIVVDSAIFYFLITTTWCIKKWRRLCAPVTQRQPLTFLVYVNYLNGCAHVLVYVCVYVCVRACPFGLSGFECSRISRNPKPSRCGASQ